MSGRLAIDFGTSNTRVAVWNSDSKQGETVPLNEISRVAEFSDGSNGKIKSSFIPTVISYDGKKTFIGKQVFNNNLLHAPATFRWIKRAISNRLELPRRIGGVSVTNSQAGADFIGQLLNHISGIIPVGDEEIAFTAPVEAYEHYQDWLGRVCEQAGIVRWRLLDEASAAALGYGVNIQGNDVYMVFDFGGGTLDVSIVRIEQDSVGGKKCRILGKQGADIGGMNIDQWLYRAVLQENKKAPEDVKSMSSLLLYEIERLKEELTLKESASLAVADPETGAVIASGFSRSRFEDILEENGLFTAIFSTIDTAVAKAREQGYEKEHIKAVLLVGGSSLIPSVRKTVRQIFGDKVKYHRPLDAVAVGAAAFVSGVDFYDHIQHEYALRFFNRQKNDYDFITLVRAATPYPAENVKELTIKASHDGQAALGLEIYEIGRNHAANTGVLDLVFDQNGGAVFRAKEDDEISSRFWINEKSPTFIKAEPPAKKGEPRFPVRFSIDGNKRLCITVTDNASGKQLFRNFPLIRLT